MPGDLSDLSLTTAAVLLARMKGFVEVTAIVPTADGDTDMDLCRASYLADWKLDVETWLRAWAGCDAAGEGGSANNAGGGPSGLPPGSPRSFFDLLGGESP